MSGHSKIGASSMYRWSKCPGSVKLSEGVESRTSKEAAEGIRAHQIAAFWLETGLPGNLQPPMDQAEFEAVEFYVKTVKEETGQNPLEVEVKFDLSKIYPGAYGTADAVAFEPVSKILRVYDYKHGQGLLVGAENNQQLMYYALGALLHTPYPCEEVEVVIIQPRCNSPDGPIRRWRFDALKLLDFSSDLYNFAAATDEPNAPLVAGDHCRFCPASGFCPKLRETALSVVQAEFNAVAQYNPKVLSETLHKLEMLEGYAKGVRAFAYAEAEAGRCPPGWKLVAKRATRKWKADDDSIYKALALEMGLPPSKLREEPVLKSPAQIEKLLTKEQKKELELLIVKESSGSTLVPDEDARAPINKAEEFTVIEVAQATVSNSVDDFLFNDS